MRWMLKSKGLSKKKIALLLATRDQLRRAWDQDEHGIEGFALNTAYSLGELEARLGGRRPRSVRLARYLKPPRRLSDLLPDKTVQQVHEYLYGESFQDALKDVHTADTAKKALERIKNTLENALYVTVFGKERLPVPRGNWLHRQILRTIQATNAKFSDSEMAELFNYFCPCGTEHKREAMKKFRSRHSLRSE
jgi:hypothetical protein